MDTLLVVAIVPAVVLLYYVYKVDPVEKEPPRLLLGLLAWGAIACIPAVALETLGTELAYDTVGYASASNIPALLVENFIVIALSEELCKYFFLYKWTWKNPAFDYVFDGIVYGVFVSLGFAIFENIGYVYEYGMATGLVRAITAIPGHAIFGVFMGCFYGLAKRAQHAGEKGKSLGLLVCALVVPVLCHGFYDFCASMGDAGFDLAFIVFLVFIMVVAMRLVKAMAHAAHPVHATPEASVFETSSYDSYQPLVDNSLDGESPTYTSPNQYGFRTTSSSGYPSAQPYEPEAGGPFSKG